MEMNKSAFDSLAMRVRSSSGMKVSSARYTQLPHPQALPNNLSSRNAAHPGHKSFSISPVGPIVPVSWPPCPASITMRPIFSPSVRVKVELAVARWAKPD